MTSMGTFRELISAEDIGHPSSDFVEAIKLLSQKVHEYRLGHNGCVPFDIFAPFVGIGGTYGCIELVVRIVENGYNRFLLKLRDPNVEQGWGNLCHIAGTTTRMTDNDEDILNRLSVEIYGVSGRIQWSDLEWICVALYDESRGGEGERLAVAQTDVFLLTIDRSQLSQLTECWKVVENLDDPKIIPGHAEMLELVNLGSNRPRMIRIKHG